MTAGPRTGGLASAWPLYLATLCFWVAVIPLVKAGFPTVIGDGSDAHLAAGTARFLAHHYPTSVHPQDPVNQVPMLWQSKTPIYYAYAAVATLAGLPTYQVLSPLSAVMLGLVVLGFFLIAREVLHASLPGALVASAAVGLNSAVLYAAMHPFYNQVWGMFAMPFALTLAWVTVRAGSARSRGLVVLLILFLAACAFAYPLALPIPVFALAVFAGADRRERRRRGETVSALIPRAWRTRRALLAVIPLGLILAVPLLGVAEKLVAAARVVLDPSQSLYPWAGGMAAYIAEPFYLDVADFLSYLLLIPLLTLGVVVALRALSRPAAWGLAAVLVTGGLFILSFRLRTAGFYFHFKLLSFLGPLVVLTAAVGFSRLRLIGMVALVFLMSNAIRETDRQLHGTSNQLPRQIIVLGQLSRQLPRGASVRLDMNPSLQLWVAYFLHPHPLCSQRPLLDASYPHVRISRRADYILVNHGMLAPVDSDGPGRVIGQFTLYRARPGLPGPSACSPRMVPVVTSGSSFG